MQVFFFPFFALFSQFFLKSNKYPSPFAAPSTKKRSNERHLPKPHLAEHHGAGPFGVFPSLADPELLQIANRNMERTQRNSTTGTTNLPAGHLFFCIQIKSNKYPCGPCMIMHLTASRKPAVNLIELCYDALWHYPIHRVAFLSQNHRNLSRATSVAKTGAFSGFQLPNLAGKEIGWKIMQKGRNVKATGRLLGHLLLPQKMSWKKNLRLKRCRGSSGRSPTSRRICPQTVVQLHWKASHAGEQWHV